MSRTVFRVGLVLLVLSGSAFSETILVPDDYGTIQEAIDAAEDGDTIEVAPDLYQENIEFLGKAITLESSDGPEDTIIDGSRQTRGSDFGSVVAFSEDEESDTVIRGFTIRNGDGSATLSTSGMTIRVGGGILCDGASPTIVGNIIEDNENDGIYCTYSEAVIEDNVVRDNEGTGVNIRSDSDVTVTNCTIEGNALGFFGGGVWVDDATGTIEGCTIVDNSASISGGGVMGNLGTMTVIDCEITGNSASTSGGGIYSDSDALIQGCVIADNTAPFGGALSILEDTTFERCLFYGNEGFTEGGLVAVLAAETATFDRCTIVDNSSGVDGALIVVGTPFFFYDGAAEFVNCILWDNDDTGDDLFEERDGTVSGTFSDIEGGWTGVGNIDEDPEFRDPEERDYRLEETSICIDTGDPDSDDDPDLTRVDMGAFYYPQLPRFIRGDVDGSGEVSPLLDALYLLVWQFGEGDDLPCDDAADINDDGSIGALLESLLILNWAFNDGDPLPDPSECGHDPTDDDLDCETVAFDCE